MSFMSQCGKIQPVNTQMKIKQGACALRAG